VLYHDLKHTSARWILALLIVLSMAFQ
jgi:hypothetical protein